MATGLQVTPAVGATIITGLTLTTANDTAYAHYQIVFPTLRGESETLMQIAEVELIGETP